MDTRRMTHRLFILLFLCVGNHDVLGQSDVNPTASPTVIPTPPSSSDSPPSDVQTLDNFPTPTRILTYPPTPLRNPVSTPTSANPSQFPSNADAITALTSMQATSFLAMRTTPPKAPASDTTFPLSTLPWPTFPLSTLPSSTLPSPTLRGSPAPFSMTTNFGMPTLAATTVPVVSLPSSVPQRCQLTFSTMLNDVIVTTYDLWTERPRAQKQLADFSNIPIDRITNIEIDSSPSGNLVLRFTIEQGLPVHTEDALQNLKNSLNTTQLHLASQPLLSPVAIYWTDNGPCPNDTCLNNAICDVTLSGVYTCSCDVSHTGPRCQDDIQAVPSDNRLLALLVLLIIPIAIAVIVGFVFGRRRQQKEQLKKAFDLRDVRTIGPRSMLSLPTGGESVGIRNQMYDTRSFAMAFTDTTFSKSSPTPSSASTNNEDSASSGEF